MKTFYSIVVLLYAMSAMVFSQTQTEFVIGAEWLNDAARTEAGTSHVLSASDWANIKDLGLNWGMVAFPYNSDISFANATLTAAEANGIELMMFRDAFTNLQSGSPAYGQRWQYHLENTSQYPSGIGEKVTDPKASVMPEVPSTSNNAVFALLGRDYPGYLAKGLIPDTEQQDWRFYYLKVRIKLAFGTPLTHTAVVTVSAVRISDGTSTLPDTIFADQFNASYLYQAIPTPPFLKSVSGPLAAQNQQVYQQSIQPASLPENINLSGIPQSANQSTTSTAYDYQIYWPGKVSCYIDCIIVDDYTANTTFSGYFDNVINTEVNYFENSSALGRYKVRDEIRPSSYGNYLCVGYIEEKIKAYAPTKAGSHYNIGYTWGPVYTKRDIVWTENSQVLTDIFPITTTPLPDDPTYTQTFQNTIQDSLVNYLSYHIAYANSYGIPFWFIPQAHSWGGGLREPTTMEQEQMVNLALAYGAKGIHYFLYWTYAPNGTVVGLGLVDVNGNPRHIIYGGTSYAGDKWATVKAINQNLAIIGPTLMNLRWQGAKSWHNGSTAGTWPNIITNITSGDAPGSRYVESGWFADASNNNYFMLVNRRTINTESRNITSTFSLPSGNYEISDVASGNAWVITNNGSFTDNFSPGQGKLYKIAPATYPTTRTLSAGQTMTVTPGAKLSFGTGASLVVNGTLNVNGTSSQRITFDRSGTSGTWGGIQINHGYYLYDRSTVQYCDIKNAATGITIYNAGPYIHHNTISGQGTYGVFSYSASPFFYNNTITGQAGGMYFGEYGSPWLVNNGTWPYGPGNNVIKSNGWGISASGSSPYLGSTIAGGYNSIYSNSTVDLWASGSGVYIWAQNNYWGGGNPNLVQLNGATINWVPALSTDPNGQGTYASQNVIAAAPSIATVSSNAVTPSIVNSTSSTTVLSAENEGLQQLLSLEINGKTDEAISGYVQLFKNDTSSNAKKYILGRLLECYSESGKKDFPAFLNQNIRTGLAATDELYAATEEVENIYLIRNGYVNQALENYKTLIKTFSNNEDIYKNALFNGWYLNYYQLKNTPQAAIYLGELKASFPNDNLTVITSLMTGITKSNSTTGEMKSNLLIGSDKQEGSFSAALPTVIELEANYPNPFNPSTVIRYQLPNTGHVSMTVFDMLGRQVATLVEGQKDAGYYSAVFDGSKYSSGIYFVRLIVQGSDSKPFLKTIKMLLAK